MSVKVFSVPLGPARSYVIQDRGTILIDGGAPDKGDAL